MNRLILAVTVVLSAITISDARSEERKPNVIVILADDLGYGDLGCYGATDIRTPNIDSLARDGMKLTSFYVHQRCSPSRLALMTGSYAHRVGTTKVIYPTDRMLDGVNLLPILLGETVAVPPHENVIMAGSTIREGDWKLFLKAEKPGGKGNQGGKETPAGSLYNVASDPGETMDVSAAHPEVVQRLRVAAEAFEKELAANSRPIGHAEGDEKDKAVPEAKTRKNTKKQGT